ncbi:adipokinetic prohormone type 2 [Anticarsia gemmatalis]|uniref:adipokinetic prohormone type 2 n=1 Tax=Anticarsia gemmatalis TaxID=129554 RepID=UPI003F757469
MCRILILFLLVAAIAVLIEGQLTFSSGWGNGKRSISSETTNDDCNPEEAIFQIYKLIVAEGEKIRACQRDGKM